MLFTNVTPSPFDLSFRLLGVPVRITPVFWVVALVLGGSASPDMAVVWVAAVLLSVLVHEFGHALLQRGFGGEPSIVLYAFGGYASAVGVRDGWWRSVLISLAGPAAGFALFGLTWAARQSFGLPDSPQARVFVGSLLWVNLVWSLVNLAPIYPLDGGRVARELCVRFLPATTGVVASLLLSITVALALAVWSWNATGSLWNVALFAALAFENYQTLQQYNLSRGA
ncbi:hypothetical protein [Botrimarina sp.]|uniref:hypothetical protein n=1 Tax=Botrimarina sp. TaxID=2795802 RepID=UPI0032EBF7A6